MRTTRRRFIKIVTAGAAALAAGAVPAVAEQKSTRPRAAARPARSRAVAAEIESQKQYVARTLKAIRGYDLPAGSEMGFAFRPLAPRRRRRGGAR